MSEPSRLRLGLQGFTPAEAQIVRDLVAQSAASWVVTDTVPIHAMLLAQGTRDGDPEHCAVLRVNLGRRPEERGREQRMTPLLLRKPIRAATLRVALDAARSRLEVHGTAESA
jgi:hypothetical protein